MAVFKGLLLMLALYIFLLASTKAAASSKKARILAPALQHCMKLDEFLYQKKYLTITSFKYSASRVREVIYHKYVLHNLKSRKISDLELLHK